MKNKGNGFSIKTIILIPVFVCPNCGLELKEDEKVCPICQTNREGIAETNANNKYEELKEIMEYVPEKYYIGIPYDLLGILE